MVIDNISNPASPTFVSQINTNLNNPGMTYLQGRYLYVANIGSTAGLAVIDVSNPANPNYVGEVDTNLSTPTSVFVAGRYAYITSSGNNSLTTFDLGGTYDQQLQAGGAN